MREVRAMLSDLLTSPLLGVAHPLAGGAGDSDKLADDAKHALFTGGCPGEMSLLQVRSDLRSALALVFRSGGT
jgi:hypothetical protein